MQHNNSVAADGLKLMIVCQRLSAAGEAER